MDDPQPTTADTTPPPASTTFAPAAPLKEGSVDFTAEAGTLATGATEQLKQGAQKLTSQATDKARGFVDQGKERATEALDQLTTLLNDAAGQVDAKLGEQYGQYARQAAGAVSGFSEQIRDKNADELMEDVRSLVRQSPAIAIGAAAAVGFALARLLSSGLDQRDA